MKHLKFFLPIFSFVFYCNAQKISIEGIISAQGEPVPFANIYLKDTQIGTTSDENGVYNIIIPTGKITLVAQAKGFRTQEITLDINKEFTQQIHFKLMEDVLGLDEIVVSATRNRVERKNTPVIVTSLKTRLLNATQSITVAEGLNFSPGVRVENNCQNCGFTQVRLNGLDGSYTQILLNSRPIFTSLLGVYGLEQIPTNSIERVEVRSRISLNLNAIQEYRRGGDRLDLAPQFTDITEELNHDTFIGGVDYELNSKDYSQKLQFYTSASYTNRESYYGGLGGARTRQDSITANNAFGTTKDLAWVNGLQYTKTFQNKDVLTTGAEFNSNATKDQIKGYNRLIDQKVQSLGDIDLNQTALSPRLTLSYQLTEALRLRGGYARGFRAPQAFNEDLHISSVGGEQQFVILSEDLNTEYSNAFTSSINYAKNKELLQVDILLEGFYTTLENPFTLVSTGAALENGSILEEVRNGTGAQVFGANLDFGISPDPRWQFQLGATLQGTRYEAPQLLFESDGTEGESDISIDEFVRVPKFYGYLNTSWLPSKVFNMDITGTYTGNMTVPRVISDTGFLQLNEVGSFFDLNIKLESHFDITDSFMITASAGVTNIFNSFQDDFDVGPTRDSDYIYGPDAPRAFFFGLKFGKFH